MAARLEIMLKPSIFDAEGETLRRKALDFLGIRLERVRVIHILTCDADLGKEEWETIRTRIFTNPVTQISSYTPLAKDFHWALWVGYRPGVMDPGGNTAREAIEDLLKKPFKEGEAVYTSRLYLLHGKEISREDVSRIGGELLANDIIQEYRVFHRDEWNSEEGVGVRIPKVILQHTPTVKSFSVSSEEELLRISQERNLFLNPKDAPTILKYFLRKEVLKERGRVNLCGPTDVELEYIAQARSDHCNHNTFKGLFHYRDVLTGEEIRVDNPFKTCIQEPTLAIAKKKPWVASVLWDNAGAAYFDEDHLYTITAETHNSPSNMEAYGGAITGIVGVYRDPMGTGRGSKIIAGMYGYCVGPRNYSGPLRPHLHPKRLLDGVIEGVRDGGNKSGVPTPFGNLFFHDSYLGKCLVFVCAVGIMPARIQGKPAHEKTTNDGDWIIMAGGRVGKDGIHGVTAASDAYSEHTPAGHVQIGDPYTQKKMHDFLLEARDENLIEFITDNGGGGLSSSVGESARFCNGCVVELDKVPLKYAGLDQWEIWVSESQERMTIAVKPENKERFFHLSKKHDVESTVIGTYKNSGRLHLLYGGKTCAYIHMDFLEKEFPQWEFQAEWIPPALRGLQEPVLGEPADHEGLLLTMLSRFNICSREWIVRQYDHEVQGGSIIKPLVGRDRDVHSDAVVLRPILHSSRGLALTQALNPTYSRIDAYSMTLVTVDEAIRRILAVGGTLDHLGVVDNFCWPNVQYHPENNPDGKFKAAQLVRANWALKEACLAFSAPLLSGKDSMYIDGTLKGAFGETHKVSSLETLQITGVGLIEDIEKCVSMDAKFPEDRIYIIGETRNELGGSEYYDLFGEIGLHVPTVSLERVIPVYRAVSQAVSENLVASLHGVYRGGLAVHLAQVAFAGKLGMEADLREVACTGIQRNDTLLYSESGGRFIATVAPGKCKAFEKLLRGFPCSCIGIVKDHGRFKVKGLDGGKILDLSVQKLKEAWKEPFRDLV